jgi:hypothetical protein
MATRAPRQPRHRNRLHPSFQPTVPPITWTASIVTGKVQVVTNLPVVLAGLPAFTVQGVKPTSISSVNATTFDLSYAATPVTTNVFVVDPNDQGVRGSTGSFLNAGSTTF